MWNSDGSRRPSAQHAPDNRTGISHFDWAPMNRILHGISPPVSSRNGSLAGLEPWARESVTSFKSSTSRTSSIISTKTRTSIMTAQDEIPSGIELTHQNGQRYRLSIDGHTTQIADSPSNFLPYHLSPALLTPAFDHHFLSPSSENDTNTPRAIDIPITWVADADASSPTQTQQTKPDPIMVSRNPSFTPGKEQLSVRHVSSGSIAISQEVPRLLVENSEAKNTQLRRRNGVRGAGLKVVTRGMGQVHGPQSPNSDASFASAASHNSPSPSGAYMGRNATGIFPPTVNLSGTASTAEGVQNHATTALNQNYLGGNWDIPSPGSNVAVKNYGEMERSGSDSDSSQSLVVCDSPTHIDEDPIGHHPPPPMNDVNDVSIHFTRLVRSLDSSHQRELQAKNQEIDKTKDMFLSLTQEISNLKAELIRTRSHMRTISEPPPQSPSDLPAHHEAKVFSFPPLNLNNVRTLKEALMRRAEKLRSSRDAHEIGALISSSHQVLEDTSAVQSRNASVDHSYLPSIEAIQPPNAGAIGQLRKALDASKSENAVLKAEVTSLQAAINRLRGSVSFWTDRYEALERQRSESNERLQSIKDDMEALYKTKWQEKEQKLLERIAQLEISATPPLGATAESE